MRWAGRVARMGERRGAHKALVGKPVGMRPLGRPRRRKEDNIKMDLRELGWRHGLDQSGSGQGQVAGCCEYGDEPSGSIKCREFFEYLRTFELLRKDTASWSQLINILLIVDSLTQLMVQHPHANI